MAGLAALIAAGGAQCASASAIRPLHRFCKVNDCQDGEQPGPLARDGDGNLFGIANGGARGAGLVFELSPQPGKVRWKYKVIHAFCQLNGCLDGEQPPYARLVVDVHGNVYGAAQSGGVGGEGVVFELSPAGAGRWTYSVVYSFCSRINCRDGMLPAGGLTYAGAQAGLPYDGRSRLYGVTQEGGGHDAGVAYWLRPRSGSSWYENVIYAFCARKQSCPDGAQPSTGMTLDAAGDLFGVTALGGATDSGVAFELVAPPPGHRDWTQMVLHSYCMLARCADGNGEFSELLEDSAGNLYGTTRFGGTGSRCTNAAFGCGIIYEIAADATFTKLYDFCSLANCADGGDPENLGGLVLDGSGDLFGTTTQTDNVDGGTIFEFSGGSYRVLYSFCQTGVCRDGSVPAAGLLPDSSGGFFGTTASGGSYNGGVAFEFSP